MRHRELYGNREIYDDLVIFRRLPYIEYGIAYLQSEIRFSSGKALRRIFKPEIPLVFFTVFLAELCTGNSDIDYLLPALSEDLFTLCERCRIIEVYDSVLTSPESLKSFFYDMFS